MRLNRMKDIAKMFDKEINERFYIRGFDISFSFTDLGLKSDKESNMYFDNNKILTNLLNGRLKIKY